MRSFLILVFVGLGLVAPSLVQDCSAEEQQAGQQDWRNKLLEYDMFYGSDDYFGESRDIAHSDPVRLTEEEVDESGDDASGDKSAASGTGMAPSTAGTAKSSDGDSDGSQDQNEDDDEDDEGDDEPDEEPIGEEPEEPPDEPPCPT